jgi:signal transduction histidine kinase
MSVAFAALTVDLMIQAGRQWSDPFTRAATSVSPVVEAALVASLVLAVGSTVVRFVRSKGDERLQMKWFAAAAVPVLLATVGWSLSYSTEAGTAWSVAWHISLLLLAASIAVAVTKYRLYDIDLVINRTVVYFSLAAVITAIYVGLAVGVGSLVGSAGKPNLPLSILATAIVAVAFQPLRQRVQHLANRLIYGERATPYEVLSDFSSRMAGAYASDDLLPRMARILTEGTGSTSGQVWLKVGGELRAAASWPATETVRPAVPSSDGSLPDLPGVTLALPVHHQGDLFGALAVTKPAGERVTPTEHRLIADLASQAGLVLRNVRLTEELLQRLDELQESRRRLVTAQDSERRRLERNIHDGAQQQLVALAMKVRLARAMTARDPAKAEELHDQIEHELAEALEDLRNLARGIYPPLLADRGLVAALDAQARRSAIPVTVDAKGIGRYSQDREAAVYFCALEALQNVAKYAGATSAAVRLREEGGSLLFEVTDDGVGFDPGTTTYGTGLQGMADRLAAMGGQLSVTSTPGAGTIVAGSIPSGS